MSLSLTIHMVEGYPLQAGARTLPIVLAIHSTEPVVVAENVRVTGLALERKEGAITDFGWDCEAPWGPRPGQVTIAPQRLFYLVDDLISAHEPGEVLPSWKFFLHAKVFMFTAVDGADREESKFSWQELRATREIEIVAVSSDLPEEVP